MPIHCEMYSISPTKIYHKLKKESMTKYRLIFLLTSLLIISGCGEKKKSFDENIKQIKHVVVIYMENHSFDNMWGEFEGANGLSNAKEENIIQVDKEGKPYDTLPEIPRSSAFPSNLPNHYFNIDQYLSSRKAAISHIHLYYYEIMQIDSGKMDKFATYNPNKGMVMGYYKTEDLPLYPIAKEYTLCDNFFHSGFGSSFFNHIFLIAARPARWQEAPSDMFAEVDSTGKMVKNGRLTPDGYVLNTIYPEKGPRPPKADTTRLMPPQTFPTIGDRLSEKDISWAWYSQGWDSAVAGKPTVYAYNHEPFVIFANYAKGTEGRKKHLKDETDFMKAAKEGNLPAVSFVKPGRGFE